MTPPTSPVASRAAAPPTAPGQVPPLGTYSAWPTTIGVIAIVLGSLGTLQGIWGICAAFMFTGIVPAGFAMQSNPMLAHPGLMATSGAISLAIAVLLLITGVGMVRRRKWSVTAARVWAVSKVLYGIVAGALGWVLAQDQLAATSSSVVPPGLKGMMGGFMAGGLILSVFWAAAFPVFLLVWLSRERIKREVAGAGWT
jgi:hypothetical protein